MTNQVLKKNMVGDPSLMGHGNVVVRVLIAIGILTLIVLTAISLKIVNPSTGSGAVGNLRLSALPDDGRAFYTEPYWNAAQEWMESNAGTKSLSALPNDGRAFYTEPYWNAAKEWMDSNSSAKSLSALPDDGRAFYTEPYWNAAQEWMDSNASAKSLSALPDDGRAFYTEPYWEAGRAATDGIETLATEPEWSYYTERYWGKNR